MTLKITDNQYCWLS